MVKVNFLNGLGVFFMFLGLIELMSSSIPVGSIAFTILGVGCIVLDINFKQ